jgi:hypothetical protein
LPRLPGRPPPAPAASMLHTSPGVRQAQKPTVDAGPGRDQPDEARPRQLADEQAALRRVATLAAAGARPAEVFSAVADERGQLIGVEATFVSRVDRPGAAAQGELATGRR